MSRYGTGSTKRATQLGGCECSSRLRSWRALDESWLDVVATDEDICFFNMVTGEEGEDKPDEYILGPKEEYVAWKVRWEPARKRQG